LLLRPMSSGRRGLIGLAALPVPTCARNPSPVVPHGDNTGRRVVRFGVRPVPVFPGRRQLRTGGRGVARRPSSRRILRLGRQAADRQPLMGFCPLQHMRHALRCGAVPSATRSRFGVLRCIALLAHAVLRSATVRRHFVRLPPLRNRCPFCPERHWLSRHHLRACAFWPPYVPAGLGRIGASCRCLARSFIAGFFACDVSYRGRRLRAALPAAFHSRRRSWGFGPFAASLRPGQRNVSTSRAPRAVFRDSASIDFRRGIGRVFYIRKAADHGFALRLLGFSPVQPARFLWAEAAMGFASSRYSDTDRCDVEGSSPRRPAVPGHTLRGPSARGLASRDRPELWARPVAYRALQRIEETVAWPPAGERRPPTTPCMRSCTVRNI
jgi:hypothetical protein